MKKLSHFRGPSSGFYFCDFTCFQLKPHLIWNMYEIKTSLILTIKQFVAMTIYFYPSLSTTLHCLYRKYKISFSIHWLKACLAETSPSIGRVRIKSSININYLYVSIVGSIYLVNMSSPSIDFQRHCIIIRSTTSQQTGLRLLENWPRLL